MASPINGSSQANQVLELSAVRTAHNAVAPRSADTLCSAEAATSLLKSLTDFVSTIWTAISNFIFGTRAPSEAEVALGQLDALKGDAINDEKTPLQRLEAFVNMMSIGRANTENEAVAGKAKANIAEAYNTLSEPMRAKIGGEIYGRKDEIDTEVQAEDGGHFGDNQLALTPLHDVVFAVCNTLVNTMPSNIISARMSVINGEGSTNRQKLQAFADIQGITAVPAHDQIEGELDAAKAAAHAALSDEIKAVVTAATDDVTGVLALMHEEAFAAANVAIATEGFADKPANENVTLLRSILNMAEHTLTPEVTKEGRRELIKTGFALLPEDVRNEVYGKIYQAHSDAGRVSGHEGDRWAEEFFALSTFTDSVKEGMDLWLADNPVAAA